MESDAIKWISVNGEKNAATLNLVKGSNVYGEKLVRYEGEEYRLWDPFRSKVDVVYCDIAQPDQTDIAIANCVAYLKQSGIMLLVVKTRSINVTMDPKAVVAQEATKLEKSGFRIDQIINLEPFDKDHGMIYCIYRGS